MDSSLAVQLDGHKYTLSLISSGGSYLKGIPKYVRTGGGAYKTFGVVEKSLECAVKYSKVFKLTAERVADLSFVALQLSIVRKFLIIPKLISHTVAEFFTNLAKFFSNNCSLSSGMDLLYAAMDLTNDAVIFSLLFRVPAAAKFLLKRACAVLSFAKLSWDMTKNYNKFQFCSKLDRNIQNLTDRVEREKFQKYISEQRYTLVIATICDIADFALTMVAFSTFVAVGFTVPGVILWGVGMASFGLSYFGGVYEKSMTYELKDEVLPSVNC